MEKCEIQILPRRSLPTRWQGISSYTKQSDKSYTISWSLLKLMSRVSDAIQPAHPLPSASPPALNLSQQWSLFQWVALHIKWPKYWSFSISPSNKYSGLISFRIDWLDLLAVEGILKSLLQHHNLKVSMLWCFVFMVQLSHLYMTTEKPHFD